MNSLYEQIYNLSNLILAWRKARKGKTRKDYVKEFEKDTPGNLLKLQGELKNQTYFPKPLVTFIFRDPKTRKISKADFRDRIVHHAIIKIIEPLFDKSFIYDSCANRIGKGNLFAIKRFQEFLRKVTHSGSRIAFCLKADIRHYFQEVNHSILIELIKRKIKDEKVIWLIKQILENGENMTGRGMPLGNLTSQFFANVYLNELDYFIKQGLKAKYYIRYVDDFVILHNSREQLEEWKEKIDIFLREKLRLELHPEKSKVIPLSKGVDFVGFRCFYYFRLLRKRNIIKILTKIKEYKEGKTVSLEEIKRKLAI
ncbi:MAG: reverse transcriptase domain-containing protein [Candidatus Pacearchaeota archaeon]|nr:reverse transcriptase domain-containing protein [Candidatus Pacearchaeota archaeon]